MLLASSENYPVPWTSCLSTIKFNLCLVAVPRVYSILCEFAFEQSFMASDFKMGERGKSCALAQRYVL